MDSGPEHDERVAAVAALDQPLRRELHRMLAVNGWTTRDEAASALGVARSVAAFHLDKLAEAGVVDIRFERTSGRQGPGAGRPSKLYRLRAAEVSASVPDRHYDLAGSLLATAVAESARSGTPATDCLREVARAAGRALGEAASAARTAQRRGSRTGAVMDALASNGFEPTMAGNEIVLRNCPFHRLAEQQRDLVCGMNRDLVAGLLDGVSEATGWTARLAPEHGSCCVRIAPG